MTETFFKAIEVAMFCTTLMCTIALAFSLFVIQTSDDLNYEIFAAVGDVFVMIPLTFAYFYSSERITTDLMEIGDIFYNSLWYHRLTVKQQKLLALPIKRSGRELRLTCLGLIDCSLPTYLSVIFFFNYINL